MEYEEKPGGNSAVSFRPEYASVAREMMRLGASDIDVARALCISVNTFESWCSTYPELQEAITRGRHEANCATEDALFRRATGYTIPVQRRFKNGHVITIRRPFRRTSML